ncbi:MAG: type II toxin-antitoxin system VapC family toxin [Propionibacteriaceae bacterium]|nr:type II toxin-antitoxin system VapC family toxin [Propionibacteriaceae bacterium]
MTAVIDASGLVEHLLRRSLWRQVATRLDSQAGAVHVPQMIFPEVASALKGLERSQEVTPEICTQAFDGLMKLPARRWPLEPFTRRAWQLRDVISIYDAYYVALAEHLHAHLITKDARLARAVEAAHVCPVELIG